MAKMFIDEVHAQNVLQRMWEQTESKEYCDIALIPGDTKEMQISAHRSVLSASSEYFKTMFTPPFNESTAEKVKLPNVDGETLKSLVKFCYSGRLEISEDTVEKLLITADSLLLDTVIYACGDFLVEKLQPTNCLGIAQLSERHRCEPLAKKAKEFCWKHFVEVYRTDEFLNLNVEQLTQLLASDDLCDPTEEHVFKSLIKWLEHDRSTREQHKDEILKLVRLPLLKPSFLFKYVKPVCTSHASLKLYTEATDWHLIPELRTENASKFTKPRKTDLRLMAISNVNNKLEVLCHCPQRRSGWMKWLENFEYRTEFCVAVMGDDLFIVGGEVGGYAVNTSICLNLKTMISKNVNPMNERRAYFGVAVINGFLYAVGGWNGNSRSSVEKWDSKTNSWSTVASMSDSRNDFGITVFNEKIYIIGGHNGNSKLKSADYYNPKENVWTSIASMCEERYSPGLAVANGMLYAVGGDGSKTIERYDHEANKWTIICSFSENVYGRLCTTFNDNVIAVFKDRVEKYNSSTNDCTVDTSIKGLKDAYSIFSFSGSLLESKFIEN